MGTRQVYSDLDLKLNSLVAFVFENLAADPTGVDGRLYYNTVNNEVRFFDGSVWAPIGSTLTAAQILAELITVDGAGSNLDADLLDGLEAAAFALAGHTHVAANITDFTTEVTSIINSVVIDAAPGTLDTLNELAAALGDDPNFATTITNLINGKVDSFSFVNTTTAASQVVTHSLGNTEAVVAVYEVSSGQTVTAEVTRNSANQHTVVFSPAPTIGQFEIVVHA